MVKFRGIDISIISQFDIRKLPEFHPPTSPDPFSVAGPLLYSPHTSTASCYVPVYPGSQIWFEYAVDGPHPENAIYFFKLLHNGRVVTSWDSTSKQGYHGKMCYALQLLGQDDADARETPLLKRQGFRFGSELEQKGRVKGMWDDCLEIRVHRVEHRQRMQINRSEVPAPLDGLRKEGADRDGLYFVNGGILEPGRPQRRYKYQLLDPVDEPYATFCFYYRSFNYLEDHNITTPHTNHSHSSSISSLDWYGTSSPAADEASQSVLPQKAHSTQSVQRELSLRPSSSFTHHSAGVVLHSREKGKSVSLGSSTQEITVVTSSRRNSEDSFRLVTKDSIEDLHSLVPRSPKSAKSAKSIANRDDFSCPPSEAREEDVPTSATKSPKSSPAKSKKSPKRIKKLTVNLDGAEYDLEKEVRRRPLSPFTSSGLLRRMMTPSPPPPSAPAAVTEFGPTIWDEIAERLARENIVQQEGNGEANAVGPADGKCEIERTTRVQRGGKALIGFLGRRIGSSKG